MRFISAGVALGALLAFVAAAIVTESGTAAFPGRNGEIVFSAVLRKNGDFNLYLVRSDGKKLRRITGARGFERYPSWSPDGRWLAYISNRSNPRTERAYEAYVMRPNGTGFRRVTQDRWIDDQLAWAPDGKRFVFGSNRVTGRFGIWVMRTTGTGATKVANDGALPAWSPDRTTIAFERLSQGSQAIWLMDADGHNQRQLTTPPSMGEERATDSMPDWSPRGDKLLFTRRFRGRTDVFVVGADGTGLRRLTTQAGMHSWPSWSPDGKRILYVRRVRRNVGIYVMNADGSLVRRVTGGGIEYAYPRWQPIR